MQKSCVPVLALVLALPLAAHGERRSAGGRATFLMDSPQGIKLAPRVAGETIEAQLADREGIEFVSLQSLLDPPEPKVAALHEAEKKIEQAKKLITELEIDKGAALLEEAVAVQVTNFHFVGTDSSSLEKHAMLLADSSMAQFLAGNEEKARQYLLRAYVFIPKLEFDPKRFPPEMKRLFDESHFLADELGKGKAIISTVPPGAEVKVNGIFVGLSPVTAKGLPTGENLVTLSKAGFRTETVIVKVPGGEKAAVSSVRLNLVDRISERTLPAVLQEVGARQPGAALATLAKRTGCSQIFIGLSSGSADPITVDLFQYRAGVRKLFAHARGRISSLEPEPGARELLSALFMAINHGGNLEIAREEKAPSRWSRFRESRLFWPIVGAVAGVVVAGACVGIALGASSGSEFDRRRFLVTH
jgi:hypothetical protein